MEPAKNPFYSQIMRHEGFEEKPYTCSMGKLTIGYGRNLEDKGITRTEAEFLFRNDVREAIQDVNRQFGSHHWFTSLDLCRKWVLIEMCFQMGLPKLLDFKKTLEYVRNNQYTKAANEMLRSQWAKQTPKRARTLSEQMRTGKLQN